MDKLPSFNEIFLGHIWSVAAAVGLMAGICVVAAFFPGTMPDADIQHLFLRPPSLLEFWYVPVVWGAAVALVCFSAFSLSMKADWGRDDIMRNFMAKGDPTYGIAGGIAERVAGLRLLSVLMETIYISVFIRALPVLIVFAVRHYNIIGQDATYMICVVLGIIAAMLTTMLYDGGVIDTYSAFVFSLGLSLLTVFCGLQTALAAVLLYEVSDEFVRYTCKRLYWANRWCFEQRRMGRSATRQLVRMTRMKLTGRYF